MQGAGCRRECESVGFGVQGTRRDELDHTKRETDDHFITKQIFLTLTHFFYRALVVRTRHRRKGGRKSVRNCRRRGTRRPHQKKQKKQEPRRSLRRLPRRATTTPRLPRQMSPSLLWRRRFQTTPSSPNRYSLILPRARHSFAGSATMTPKSPRSALSPIPYPLFLIPYPLSLIPYPLSLIPHPLNTKP